MPADGFVPSFIRQQIAVVLRVVILSALTSLAFPATVGAKSWCEKKDPLTALRGNGLCLIVNTYNANLERKTQPTLVVMLHGDLPRGGPADYHKKRMRELARDENIVSVALVRPGYYADKKSRLSEGSHFGRGNNYTEQNVRAVGEVVQKLKRLHNAKRFILIGHSGGAATAGVIIGMFPGLVDKAVLVSCPCNIRRWRKRWTQSLSPSSFVKKIPLETEVVAITGKNDRNAYPALAKAYVAQLKQRDIKARLVIAANAAHDFGDVLWYQTSEAVFE